MIDLLTPAQILCALYHAARCQGIGAPHYDPQMITEEEAQKAVDSSRNGYIDYYKGRVIKTDVKSIPLGTFLYDRDNGEGAAGRAIARYLEQITKPTA